MKSLFLRLLFWMWLSMALLGGIFALIHAQAFPTETLSPRRRYMARVLDLRAEQALQCRAAGGTDCAAYLEPIDRYDDRIAIYQGEEVLMGEPVPGAKEMRALAHASPDRIAFRQAEQETLAVASKRDPSMIALGVRPNRSRWVFFIGPETLPYRLSAIVAVTGLISFLFARHLSRPLRILRAATQRVAAGDLSVRVVPELGGADVETLALGSDMDRMSERIEALLSAQRRLLRDVSHELRSPLARLAISLELVRRRSGPDSKPALDRIERETERLNAMIGELLSLSRLEAEDALPVVRPVEVGDLVQGVLDDATLEAQARQVSVTARPHDGPCIVDGHAELLRRAIENVVRNAVRFSESGSSVCVEVHCDDAAVTVRVRDHGPGVPESALARIFEPFFRVEDDRARSQGGTGIGLAIAQRALLVHGGTVGAENAPDGGLLVTLRIPRRPLSRGAAAPELEPGSSG